MSYHSASFRSKSKAPPESGFYFATSADLFPRVRHVQQVFKTISHSLVVFFFFFLFFFFFFFFFFFHLPAELPLIPGYLPPPYPPGAVVQSFSSVPWIIECAPPPLFDLDCSNRFLDPILPQHSLGSFFHRVCRFLCILTVHLLYMNRIALIFPSRTSLC